MLGGQSVLMVCSTLGNLIGVLRMPSEILSSCPVPSSRFPTYDAWYYLCSGREVEREEKDWNWLPRSWELKDEEWKTVSLIQHQDLLHYQDEATWTLLLDTLEVGMVASYWRNNHLLKGQLHWDNPEKYLISLLFFLSLTWSQALSKFLLNELIKPV